MTHHLPSYKDILLTIENDIATLTINRTNKLNAIRLQTYHDIIAGFKEADASNECKCIVIAGTNNTFTAGNDLTDLVGNEAKDVMIAVQSIFDTVSELKKPRTESKNLPDLNFPDDIEHNYIIFPEPVSLYKCYRTHCSEK
jgi:hypothetical protein